MVVAKKMTKPVLKVSMDSESEEESSSTDGPAESDNEARDSNKPDAEVESTNSDIGEDVDAESGVSGGENDDNEDVLMSNEGWADSIAKILGSNKPKSKKTLVLSRAKKHSVTTKIVKDEKPQFEVIGANETEEKIAVKKEESVPESESPPKKVKHIKPSIRIKPNILEKDRERLLSKVATKGVVQLFNAVRNQQKTLRNEMDRNDLPESKKEKILKKFDKRAFLDTLMGQSKSIVVDEAKVTKNELKDEDKPKWSALRDDFMMGAKMRDWDKESVDE